MAEQEHIGYLVRARHVRCRDCEAEHNYDLQATTSLFRVNIGQYGQTCHECGDILVEPPSEAWPELFSHDGCRVCILQREDASIVP